MYTEKAYHIADNCRFCWMCRHVCPVGLMTGKEINTPRAKALLVSMEKRGIPMDREAAASFFECMLCEGCSNDCATGFEPPVFIREARAQAAAEGLLPAEVAKVLDRLLETGILYEEIEEDPALAEKIRMHQEKAPILVLLGMAARYRVPEMAVSLIEILEHAGVDFMLLEQEPAAGSELYDLIGQVEETRQQALACGELFAETGAECIIVLDSYLAETLKHQFPVWGCSLPEEVVTATTYVDRLTKENRLAFRSLGRTVTVHDSPRLARGLEEMDPVRNLAKKAGCEIREMFLHGKLTKCCGSSLFGAYAPEIALLTAKGRWEDAKRTEAGRLLVECPQALEILKRAEHGDMELMDIFSLLKEALV